MSVRNLSDSQFDALAQTVNADHAQGKETGFSVHTSGPNQGREVKGAYVVGGAGAPEQAVPLPTTGQDIKSYAFQNEQHFSNSDAALGGWAPPPASATGSLYLDHSNILPRPDLANEPRTGAGAQGVAGTLSQPSSGLAMGHVLEHNSRQNAQVLAGQRGEDAYGQLGHQRGPDGTYFQDAPGPDSKAPATLRPSVLSPNQEPVSNPARWKPRRG